MANYYATARSNYFKVKDVAAFREWATPINIEVIEGDGKHEGLVCLIADDGDQNGWPSWRPGEGDGEDTEIDLAQEIAAHLVDGHVAILMEAGAEKVRYVSGWAMAVNSKGETESVSLQDIYEMAEHLGEHVTRAEY
jgi:hypothetical protein